jgi:hypothetical protein
MLRRLKLPPLPAEVSDEEKLKALLAELGRTNPEEFPVRHRELLSAIPRVRRRIETGDA